MEPFSKAAGFMELLEILFKAQSMDGKSEFLVDHDTPIVPAAVLDNGNITTSKIIVSIEPFIVIFSSKPLVSQNP